MIKVIVISGQQGSGKSTLANNLVRYFSQSTMDVKYADVVKFADPLYKCQDAISDVLVQYDIPMEMKEGLLLQALGDWGRNVKGVDVWINVALNRVEAHANMGTKVVIIEDCRYKAELEQFPDALKIRLNAPEAIRKERAESWRGGSHSSESGLDNCDNRFDLVIDTDFNNKNDVLNIVRAAFINKFGVD